MKFRPMTMDDADKMLEWKNYPETREFAIASHDEIKKEDHLKWLEKHLDQFQVMEGYAPMGAIRINDGEVSIWVDKAFRNMGVGTMALVQKTAVGMRARIVEGNVKSMRIFINAGFKPFSYKDNYYIFAK